MSRLLSVLTLVAVVAASGCAGHAVTPPATAAPPSPGAVQGRPSSDAREAVLGGARSAYGAVGAVAVAEVAGERWRGASGTADTDGTPIRRDTRWRIASITKPIVAALVLDAVRRGELALDDVVAELLPRGLVRPDPPVTVRMLLDHTSGVFDSTNDGDPTADLERLEDPAMRAQAAELLARYEAGEPVVAPPELIVALAETHERLSPPGAGYHYSNVNYLLAGLVLERVTGWTLAELVQDRIATPLRLEHTTLAPDDRRSPDLRGYLETDAGRVDVTDDLTLLGNGGGGGIVSTADELLTMLQAIMTGRLVPGPLLAEMKQTTSPSDGAYGLGLATYNLACGTFYGHGGSVNGTVSLAVVAEDGGDGAIVAMSLRAEPEARLLALAETLVCSGDLRPGSADDVEGRPERGAPRRDPRCDQGR